MAIPRFMSQTGDFLIFQNGGRRHLELFLI